MKVLTIGSATIDSIAIIEAERIERMTMRNAETSFLLLEEGRKIEALQISNHCGGGAVNAAVAFARLGCDVAALVKLGQDARAEQILARLAEEGVSTRHARRDRRAPTGASVLVSAHDRNAAIFTFRGANTLLEPADLKADAFNVDLVHVSGLSGNSADRFPEIAAKAKAAGARLSANPGIRQLSSRAGAFLEHAREIAILSLNRAEAEALMPHLVQRFGEGGPALLPRNGAALPAIAARGLSSGGFEMSLPRFLSALCELGIGDTILTDGTRGALLGRSDGIHYCPTLATEVAGTAGAGDAFVATFAAFAGADPGRALRLAAVNAASVVGHADTQTGLLTRSVLEKRLGETARALPLTTWRGKEGAWRTDGKRSVTLSARR